MTTPEIVYAGPEWGSDAPIPPPKRKRVRHWCAAVRLHHYGSAAVVEIDTARPGGGTLLLSILVSPRTVTRVDRVIPVPEAGCILIRATPRLELGTPLEQPAMWIAVRVPDGWSVVDVGARSVTIAAKAAEVQEVQPTLIDLPRGAVSDGRAAQRLFLDAPKGPEYLVRVGRR